MSTKQTAEKLLAKKALLVERSAKAFAINDEQTILLLSTQRRQSIRLNPLRIIDISSTLSELRLLGWQGEPFSWCKHGYSVETDVKAIRDSSLIANGQVYIQNAASWLPVLTLDPRPGEKILDMCAAPGGKASHIAAITNNQAELWVNDNSRIRLAKMRANFVRLGVKTARETLFDIMHLAKKLDGVQFDKILLDAPCSGEGLMTLSDKDLQTWSIAHIKRLQQLQKRAILQAWQLLRPGGTLIYSTCTIAPEENELVIDYLLRKQENTELQPIDIVLPNQYPAIQTWNNKPLVHDLSRCLRLAPSSNIEAFFVAKLQKTI